MWWKILLLTCGSVVLSLALCEWVVSRFPHAGSARKIEATVPEPKCYANCYTSDPRGYFPLKMNVPLADVSGRVKDTELYCLPYACQQRKAGFYPDRKEEIFLVGDSFAFGEGVKEEDTLGYVLGQRFTQYNFRNFGETAADLKRVGMIVEDLLAAHPLVKHIIYFYNLNDVAMAPSIEGRQKYIIDFENLRWTNLPKDQGWAAEFLSRSALYKFVRTTAILHRETALTIQNYRDMYFSAENKNELDLTFDRLIAMNQLARAKGARFTLVIYPLLYKDLWGAYPFQSIHNLLMDACRQHNINCIDGIGAFDGAYNMKQFIVHPVDFHPNGLANARMADFLWARREQWQ